MNQNLRLQFFSKFLISFFPIFFFFSSLLNTLLQSVTQKKSKNFPRLQLNTDTGPKDVLFKCLLLFSDLGAGGCEQARGATWPQRPLTRAILVRDDQQHS